MHVRTLSLAALLAAVAIAPVGCSESVMTVPVARVEISPPATSVQVGETRSLTARLLADGGEPLSGWPVEWRSLHPEFAVVDGNGHVSGIAVGTATIEASSGGITGTSQVSVTSGPVITLSATTVDVTAVRNGATPGDRTVSVENGGTGTLNGLSAQVRHHAGEPTGWLTATIPATAPTTLVLSVNQAGLVPGTYTASVDVASAAASNSPVVLTVRLTVADAPPAIALGATTLTFSAAAGAPAPAAQTVAVTNAGGSSLAGLATTVGYAAGQPSGWLSAVLSSTAAPASITVRAATAGLAPGTYTGTVSVASAAAQNSPQQVAVTLTIGDAQPGIQLSASAVTFTAPQNGTSTPPQTVQVTNSGGGTLAGLGISVTFPGGQPSGWLSASLSVTAAPATVTLAASPGALTPGSYSATVSITSPGAANSPQQIGVTFSVQDPAPSVVATPASASFTSAATDGEPPPAQIAIANGGGGTISGLAVSISYASGSATGWLTAELAGTTAPTSLTLRAQRGTLSVGTHGATVRITSAQASARDIPVSYTIAATAPAAPTAVAAAAVSHDRVEVRWTDGSQDEDRFEVGRSTDDGATWPATFNAAASAELFVDDALAPSTSYAYRVRACNAIGCSAWSTSASATTAPLPPSAVVASAVSATQIDVSWTNQGTGATDIVLERSADGSSWSQRATVGPTTTAFSDTQLTPGSTSHYRLRSCRGGVCSGPSATAQATTPSLPVAPAAPSSLTATANGTSIGLVWSAADGIVTEYRLERSVSDASSFAEIATLAGNLTEFVDDGLEQGTTYYYRVRAGNSAGLSNYSPVASATTLEGAPDKPVNVTTAAISSTEILVSWSAVAGAARYEARRMAESGPWGIVAQDIPAATPQYVDEPGAAGSYRYSIRACAGALCSSWSSPSPAATVSSDDEGGAGQMLISLLRIRDTAGPLF